MSSHTDRHRAHIGRLQQALYAIRDAAQALVEHRPACPHAHPGCPEERRLTQQLLATILQYAKPERQAS